MSTISNFALDCNSPLSNSLSWNINNLNSGDYVVIYSGPTSGTKGVLATINAPTATDNEYIHSSYSEVCNNSVDYYLEIYNGLQVLQHTSDILTCTNNCRPPDGETTFSLNCDNATSSGIGMSWALSGIDAQSNSLLSINIFRSTTDPALGGVYNKIATLPYGTTSYVDTSVTPGTVYWYSMSYSYTFNPGSSGVIVTDGPCLIPETKCKSNLEISSFVFNLTPSCDDKSICLSGFINSSGTYQVPDYLACSNIESISSVFVRTWNKCCGSAPENGELVSSSSDRLDLTKECFIWKDLEDGIYTFELTVNYIDKDGIPKTIISTQCAYLGCDIRCKISNYLSEDMITNLEAALIYDNIGYAADCGSCRTACDLLEYLNILVKNVCDCK